MGFKISFIEGGDEGMHQSSSSNYGLNYQDYGTTNGLMFFSHNEYNFGLCMKIETSDKNLKIKKITFGKTKQQQYQYHFSSFTQDDCDKINTNSSDAIMKAFYENDGTFSFEATNNYIIFTPDNPSSSIRLDKVIKESGKSDIRFNYIGITWVKPLAAPSVNTYGLPTTEGSYPYYDANSGSYLYNTPEASVKIKALADATKIIYTTNGDDPNNNNSVALDPKGDEIKLPKAIPGQETILKARGVDENGNLGMILTVNCKRIALQRPTAPRIRKYTQDFQYTQNYNVTFQNMLTVTDGSWESYTASNPTINLNARELLIDFEQAYADQEKDRYGGNRTITEPKSADLEYQISMMPVLTDDQDDEYISAGIFACDEKLFTGQNHWLAISAKKNLNGGTLLFSNNTTNECYLHLRATRGEKGTDEYVTSDVVTVKLCRKAPDAPKISLSGSGTWNDRGTVPVLSFIGQSEILIEQSNQDMSLVYQFEKHTDGQPWPGNNPGNVQYLPLQGNFLMLKAEDGEGRLYVCQKDSHGLLSAPALLDIEPINADYYRLDAQANSKPAQQALVAMLPTSSYNFKIMGVYETDVPAVDGKTTYYVYLMDGGGYPIKLVVNATEMPEILQKYLTADKAIQSQIVGRVYYHSITSVDKLMPEIWVTPGSEDFTGYLPEATATWVSNNVDLCPDRTSIDERDFNRKVRLRSLTWLGGNRVRTTDGRELTLYSRLKVDGYDFQDDMANVDRIAKGEGTKLFAATGYVGQLNGQLALLTTEPTLQCPGTPNLFAPNPITGEPDKDGYIEVNAISDFVEITVKGNANGESTFIYANSEKDTQPLDVVNGKIPVNRPAQGNTLYHVIWSKLNGMTSLKPAKIKITFHNPTEAASIEAFKKKEFERVKGADALPETAVYYRMSGNAVIEDITPEYIYVRDYNNEPEAELIDDEHMRRLLIRNTNGWEALVTDPAGGEPRKLQVNDVITGFAICPRHINGNLISDATGFARTFQLVKHDADYSFNPEEIQAAPTDNFSFTNEHRMRLVTLKGVEVKRTPNLGNDKNEYPYNYTLDVDGQPRMRMDIFRRSGFAEAFAEGTGFDLTGVVLLDSDDEQNPAYALALMRFAGSGKVAAPEVYLDGIAEALRGETEQTFVAGKIVMAPTLKDTEGNAIEEDANRKVTIHYSIDGLDPLQNLGSRHRYGDPQWADELLLDDRDVEIRAFASYPGMTPSDVVVRRFRKQSNDVQYILNFLNTAREGSAYRFTSNVKAMAVGGDYLFVAGSVGHYLPIYKEGGWNGSDIEPGDYLKLFTVGYRVDANGNRMAVATGYDHTFGNITKEADIDEAARIAGLPDVVSSLSTANARRLVRVMNVRVAAPKERIGQWTLTELADGKTHPLMNGLLGNVTITDADGYPTGEELTDGETYNITGFVMLGAAADDGTATVELWPMSAIRVTRSAPVTVSMTNLTDGPTTGADGEIRASFNGMTEVTLTTTGHNTSIYYWLESEEPDEAKATWYLYQRPFIITGSERIHAKSQAEGMAESDHTHISLTPVGMSGDVEFEVKATDGSTAVVIKAAEGARIWYSTGTPACDKSYTAGTVLTFSEETMLYACAQEPGQGRGRVSRMLVMVKEAVPDNIETTGNRLLFSQTVTDEGYAVVTIEAAAPVVGGTIYYTTEAGKKLPGDGKKYDGPIVMTQSGVIIAVMVIEGRPVSQAYETNVWVVPVVTGIEDVESDSRETVRAEGSDIMAPAGSAAYDLSGRRVGLTGLSRGIYIVRTPDGKAVKVMIR